MESQNILEAWASKSIFQTVDLERCEMMMRSFCVEASRFGKRLVATHDEFKKFRSLEPKQQLEIMKTFSSYFKLLMRAVKEGIDIHDSLSTAWWTIRELGLRPPADLFGSLTEEDVIEIYSPTHIQIFRSFNFFDLTSYSIEDIFCYSWTELYSRSEFITQDMIVVATGVLSGSDPNLVKTDFPVHIVSDKFSPNKDWSLIRHKLLAPLVSSDNRIFLFNSFNVVEAKQTTV